MGNEITRDELEKLSYKTLDELYESYEIKHSFTTCIYLRFNGDAEDPGELLTKEEFKKLCFDSTEWVTAYESLYNYIAKEYKLKQLECYE